jgi:hypothetical protein
MQARLGYFTIPCVHPEALEMVNVSYFVYKRNIHVREITRKAAIVSKYLLSKNAKDCSFLKNSMPY